MSMDNTRKGKGRSNEKITKVHQEDTFRKSNQLSLAKLNQSLTLNQMRLFAFFIFSTQQRSENLDAYTYRTIFTRADFQKKFGMENYRTDMAVEDAERLFELKISFVNLKEDKFNFSRVFYNITYEKGKFTFLWNASFLPHILDLQGKYIINNLSMTSHFKSAYSWMLYEALKVYFNQYHKVFTKEEILSLFNVEDVPTYVSNTSRFKKSVLDVAKNEINEFTEIEVSYEEIKKGRKVIAFDIHWSSGEQLALASQKTLNEIRSMIKAVTLDAARIITIADPNYREEATESFLAIDTYRTMFESNDLEITQEIAGEVYRTISHHMNIINLRLENKDKRKPPSYNFLEQRE